MCLLIVTCFVYICNDVAQKNKTIQTTKNNNKTLTNNTNKYRWNRKSRIYFFIGRVLTLACAIYWIWHEHKDIECWCDANSQNSNSNFGAFSTTAPIDLDDSDDVVYCNSSNNFFEGDIPSTFEKLYQLLELYILGAGCAFILRVVVLKIFLYCTDKQHLLKREKLFKMAYVFMGNSMARTDSAMSMI